MEVAKYIGLPFEKYNCAALAVKVSREQFGKEIPLHVSECADPLDKIEVAELLANEIQRRWIKVEKWQPGDFVLFIVKGVPSHIGVMIGDEDRFLHSWGGSEASAPRLSDVHWRNRIVGFYRFNG